MANAALLKGGVIVVLLLAVLAGFDAYSKDHSQITGYQIGSGSSCPSVNDLSLDVNMEVDESSVKTAVASGVKKALPSGCSLSFKIVYVLNGELIYNMPVTIPSPAAVFRYKFPLSLLKQGFNSLEIAADYDREVNDPDRRDNHQFLTLNYGYGTSTGQTAKCPSTITVSSNKQTAYLQGETAVFTITMRDSAGNIVKRGASLGISSATETPGLMFGKAFPATDSGIVTVAVPLTGSIYQPGGYAVQVSGEAGDCDYVSGGQSLAVQAAEHTVPVAKGWNMLSLNTTSRMVSTTCDPLQFGTGPNVPYFNPVKQEFTYYEVNWSKYVSDPDIVARTIGLPFGRAIPDTRPVAWVYNFGEPCAILSHIIPQQVGAKVFKGWNSVGVPPDWVGKSIGELASKCDLKNAWLFYPERSDVWEEKFDWVRPEKAIDVFFEPVDVGRGFWIEVGKLEGCQLYAP